MGAVGKKRHGVIGQPASDLDAHEHGSNNRRPLGFGFSAGMALTQEHMVAGPDAMIMRLFGHTIMVVMTMIVVMMMIMAMVIVAVGMTVRMPVQGVVVRHGASLARYRHKISLVCRAISRKSG
jgi:hypothetical protein